MVESTSLHSTAFILQFNIPSNKGMWRLEEIGTLSGDSTASTFAHCLQGLLHSGIPCPAHILSCECKILDKLLVPLNV